MPTAIVTGASSGIGRAIARVLAQHHYDLVLVARREDLLNTLKQELSTFPVQVTVHALDLAQVHAGQKLFDWTQDAKISVDVVVNNAGFGEFGNFEDIPLQRQLDMIQLNISTLTELSHLYLPGMRQRRSGHIVNIASTAAFQPGPTMSVYFATKAYVLSFSEALSEELLGSGVHVTAICPGPTQSEFIEAAHLQESNLFKRPSIPTSEELAQFTWGAMQSQKVVAVHGWMNAFLVQVQRISPRFLNRKIVKWMLAKSVK